MDDSKISDLYRRLVAFMEIAKPYELRIRRRHFVRKLTSGFTNDKIHRVELDINMGSLDTPEHDDLIAVVLIHELIHVKYPEKTDFELMFAEVPAGEPTPDVKTFERFFGRKPLIEFEYTFDDKEEEEYLKKFEESSSFYVKYIDLTTGKKEEKTIPDREQYDLYKLQREGKISIIDIHKVK